MPDGDCGDGIKNPYPEDQVANKNWSQRRRLFSKFDLGIELDKESWYSVTPEAIANHHAAKLVSGKERGIVLDPFCGCGGNVIAFAAREEVEQVICVDVDEEKLRNAYHNATIYGVEQKLLLIHGNACDVLSRYKNGRLVGDATPNSQLPSSIDVIFLSPPWGGPDYGRVDKITLQHFRMKAENGQKINGADLLQYAATALGHDKPIAYFLPKKTDGEAIANSAYHVGYRTPIVMEQNFLNSKLKTTTAYLGLGGE